MAEAASVNEAVLTARAAEGEAAVARPARSVRRLSGRVGATRRACAVVSECSRTNSNRLVHVGMMAGTYGTLRVESYALPSLGPLAELCEPPGSSELEELGRRLAKLGV